jgi:sigma-B regulation protein RsbU (phosphoserine phosphatase)
MSSNLFDKAPCGYLSFFDDGNIHVVNDTTCSLLGYQKDELEGRNIEIIFTIATKIFYQTHFFPLVKMQGHAEELFITLLRKDGSELPVLLNAKRENEVRPFTACAFIVVINRRKFEDELIAARKQAEAALRENTALVKAKADLQLHAEQLDAQVHVVNRQNHELKQLNHVITHNLKEPLRKMLLFADRLREKNITEEAAQTLERLNRASSQMRNTVQGLQQYVWLDDAEIHFAITDLQQLIRRTAQKINESLDEELIDLKMAPLPAIEADEVQMELLFFHLMLNAVKFRKGDKAFVEISASIIQQNRMANVEGKYHYEDFLKLEFSDRGIGFEPELNEHVFELFRKNHSKEGVGLGLALCKKIAANHFGYIRANGKVNEGVVITLLVPVGQSFYRQRQDPESNQPKNRAGQQKI